MKAPRAVERDAKPPVFPDFALARDIFIAPDRAIARIAETRDWVTTGILLIVLGALTALLEWPAVSHLAIASQASQIAETPVRLTPDQISSFELHRLLYVQTSAQFLNFALIAAIFTLFARFRSAGVPYSTLFALTVNAALPSAVGGLLAACAIRLHDPASFHTVAQLALALPINLVVLAPHGGDLEASFLSNFDLFEIWTLVLTGYGYAVLTKARLPGAIALALAIGIVFALGPFDI